MQLTCCATISRRDHVTCLIYFNPLSEKNNAFVHWLVVRLLRALGLSLTSQTFQYTLSMRTLDLCILFVSRALYVCVSKRTAMKPAAQAEQSTRRRVQTPCSKIGQSCSTTAVPAVGLCTTRVPPTCVTGHFSGATERR